MSNSGECIYQIPNIPISEIQKIDIFKILALTWGIYLILGMYLPNPKENGNIQLA